MQVSKLAIAVLGAFALMGNASAVTFNGATGAAVVSDYSAASALSFDLDFSSIGNTTLNFGIEADDLVGGSLSFNALVRNLSGLGFTGTSIKLLGATFASAGSIATDGFQVVSGSGSTSNSAWATFAPALTTEFYVGAPLGTGTDWNISLAGKNAGDVFSIMVSVPEPESYAMFLAGLGLLGAAAKRRKQA